jgi:sulfate permease, SulP family
VHLSPDCKQLLERAGNLVEINVIEDPNYFVAEDKLD